MIDYSIIVFVSMHFVEIYHIPTRGRCVVGFRPVNPTVKQCESLAHSLPCGAKEREDSWFGCNKKSSNFFEDWGNVFPSKSSEF